MNFYNYKIVLCRKFKIGDLICHKHNLDRGFVFFSIATDYDVDNYSGRNGYYYRMTKTQIKK